MRKDTLEFPDVNSEMRFPNLGLPLDLWDPINRLSGIENYCNLLLHFENAARRFWSAEDAAANAYELSRRDSAICTREYVKELQGHSEVYRKVCEDYQNKLDELAEACSRAIPDELLSCKVVKLHPQPLYIRSTNTNWEDLRADLKRLQVLAHRELVSKREPKALAAAVESFLHEIGSMRSGQMRLFEKITHFRQLLNVGERDVELQKSISELTADISEARKKVEAHRNDVLARTILPGHAIEGVSPEEWRFQFARDTRRITVLVAGEHSDPKIELSEEEEDKEFIALWQGLRKRGQDAACLTDAPKKKEDAIQNNYYGTVDQRQQTINAVGNRGIVGADIQAETVSTTANDSAHSKVKRKGLWGWLMKPVIVRTVGAVAAAIALFFVRKYILSK